MPRKTKRNDITSVEVLSNVNPDNIRLQEDFMTYLRSVNRSEGTINGYRNDLEILWCFLYQRCNNKKFQNVTKRDLVLFQSWLVNDNGNSPARVRRLKSAISSLSNYISNVLDDEPEFDGFKSIIKKIENPVNQTVREKTILTDEQLDQLLNALVAKKRYKQACALSLAMCSGRRKAELTRIKVSYYADENIICGGSLYQTPEKVKTKGFGNGKYITCYTLAHRFKPYFDMWMQERADSGIESEWLLPDAKDASQPISISTLNSWADVFSRMTGLNFYWHSLRHYFTTHLAQSGLPDNVIQDIVGWSSAEMVRLYDDRGVEDKLEKYFDGDGIRAQSKVGLEDLH